METDKKVGDADPTALRATEGQIDAAEAEYSYLVNCADSPFLSRDEIRKIVEEALNAGCVMGREVW